MQKRKKKRKREKRKETKESDIDDDDGGEGEEKREESIAFLSSAPLVLFFLLRLLILFLLHFFSLFRRCSFAVLSLVSNCTPGSRRARARVSKSASAIQPPLLFPSPHDHHRYSSEPNICRVIDEWRSERERETVCARVTEWVINKEESEENKHHGACQERH